MNRSKTIHVPALAFLVGLVLLVPAFAVAEEAADADPGAEAEARKARILANLKLKFPQLEQASIKVGDIVPTEFEGLDQGSFTMPGRGGTQQFLVSRDDKKFWLTSGDPIDVSLTEDEIKTLVAEREAAKQLEAEERQTELAEATKGAPARGNPAAPVTIVKFSEFQCPYCTRGAATVAELLEKYPDDVKYVFKHFPLGFHNWAKPAAIASQCAANQSADAFWTLHDKYFEAQRTLTAENIMEMTKGYLADAGIDMEQWSTCAEDTESETYKAALAVVDADAALGTKLGVTGTPGFFVNGHFLKGAQPATAFEPLIQAATGGGSPAPTDSEPLP
jgi:protein-disulfide isomerase